VLLFSFVACEIGMDAFCEFAKKCLQGRRRVNDFRLAVFGERSFMRLICACARFLCTLASAIGAVKVCFALGNARFQVIEFGVELADLAEVTALERSEQRAELCQFRLALGKEGARRRQLPAPFMQAVVCGGLENEFGWDLGWQAVFLRLSYQFI